MEAGSAEGDGPGRAGSRALPCASRRNASPARSRPSTPFRAPGGEGGATEFVYLRAHPPVFALPVLRQETSRSGFTPVSSPPPAVNEEGLLGALSVLLYLSEFPSFMLCLYLLILPVLAPEEEWESGFSEIAVLEMTTS